MFAPDPIDLFDPSPYGAIAYYGHLAIGLIAFLAAGVALASRKGSRTHRRWGVGYIGAVALVCLTSAMMLSETFIPPLFLAVFTTVYAIGGAWLALQPGTRAVLLAEKGLFLFELIGLSVFLSIAVRAAVEGIVPPFAPLVIAIIPLILIVGDINWFAKGDRRKELRIARHLSRMVWGFVVVVRAPLVEIVAAGLPLPQISVIVGPILLGVAMLWYFQRRYGGAPFGKRATASQPAE